MRVLVFNGWAAGPETWRLCGFPRDWTFDYIEQLDGLPEKIADGFDDVVLVGFSMGGTSALRFLLKHPEKVRGLILVSTTARMMEDPASGWKGLSERRLAALRLGTELVFRDDPSPLYDRASMARGLECLHDVDVREALKGLGRTDFPVYVFHSENDGIVRRNNVDFFRSVFPQAKVTLVPGNEHVLPITIPEKIDAAVRECLLRCSVRILFVWTGVTSYMADCWRTLQRELRGGELRILIEDQVSGRDFEKGKVLAGLDCTVVGKGECPDLGSLLPEGWRPDVVFAVGWHSPLVRAIVADRAWAGIPKVCCFDLPWDGSLRRIAARWVLARFLRNYTAAYVPGRACAEYAEWLGFGRIDRGLFSIDTRRFAAAPSLRKGFLFVGRFAPEKRVDLVAAAWRRYRDNGGTWAIDFYGSGPLAPEAADPGLRVHPFAQTDDMPRIYREHACLVLASDFDPWPLVVLEAKASGCRVVMTDRCTNRYELADGNDAVVAAGDVEAMAAAMMKMERDGSPSERTDLTPWDCGTWAERTMGIAADLIGEEEA